MYHQKIAEKINAAQSGNKDSILDLMNMFRPLLRSLATHLNYEDAINDLELEFIQLIKTIKLSLLRSCDDGSIIRYIQQSLKYKSYQLSNTHRAKMRTEIPHCSYSEEQLFAIENQNAICDDYGSLLLSEAKMVLTKKEYEIIKKHIIDDVPTEATEMFHILKNAENPHFYGFRLHTFRTTDKVVRYGINNQFDFAEHPAVIQRGEKRTINICVAVPDVA